MLNENVLFFSIVEPQNNEGPRDWQMLFAITS